MSTPELSNLVQERRQVALPLPGVRAQVQARLGQPGSQLAGYHLVRTRGLAPPVDLGAAILGDRLDGRAGKRLIGGEQPAQRLDLGKAAVEEQVEGAGQAPHHLTVVDERGRHAERAGWALDSQQLAFPQELLDAARGRASWSATSGMVSQSPTMTSVGGSICARLQTFHISRR